MAKVQDYGKDTDIDIDSVLYFEAGHKYVEVTYWSAAYMKYKTAIVQWSLIRIRAAHPEFERTHRGILARKTAIVGVIQHSILSQNWYAELSATEWDKLHSPSGFRVPVSRRLLPHIRKIADANRTAT